MISDFTSWEDTLVHHGIKGMKWGVRRFQNEDGSLTRKGLFRYRNPKHMTDAELKAGIKRAELEKKYRELTRPSGGLLKIVSSVIEAKKAFSDMELERAKTEAARLESVAKITRAKADAKVAKSSAKKAKFEGKTYRTIAKRREEKAAIINSKIGLKKTKDQISRETIRGSIRRNIAKAITKHGNSDHKTFIEKGQERIQRGKGTVSRIFNKAKNKVVNDYQKYSAKEEAAVRQLQLLREKRRMREIGGQMKG